MKRISICINGTSITEYKLNVPDIGKNNTYYHIYVRMDNMYYSFQSIIRCISICVYGMKEYIDIWRKFIIK